MSSRGAAVACPVCQTKPRKDEFDRHVERRRNVLQHVDRTIEAPSGVSCELENALDDIERWYSRGYQALRMIANGGKELKPLSEAYAALEWHIATWGNYKLRPLISKARATAEIAQAAVIRLEGFQESAVAPRGLDAQRIHERIDKAWEVAVDKYIGILRAHEENDQLGANRFEATGKSILDANSESNFLDLEENLTAKHGLSDRGLGVAFEASAMASDLLFDSERYGQIVAEANRIGSDRQQLNSIVESSPWVQKSISISVQTILVWNRINRATDQDDTDEGINALFDAIIQFREGNIKHGLATLLANDPADYVRLMKKPTGSVINAANKKHPGLRLDDNLNSDLRHVGAHKDYTWDSTTVTCNLFEKPSTITHEELFNEVLAHKELATALHEAINRQTMSAGLPADYRRHINKPLSESLLNLFLATSGYSNITCQWEETSLSISVDEVFIDEVGLAAMLTGVLPESIQTLALCDGGSTTPIVVDCAILAKNDIGIDRDVELIAVSLAISYAAVTRNGVSTTSFHMWNKVLHNAGRERELEGALAPLKRIRTVHELAVDSGIKELTPVYEQLRRAIRDSAQLAG